MYYFVVFICSVIFLFGLIFIKKPFFSFCKAATNQLNTILDNALDPAVKQSQLVSNLLKLLTKFSIFLLLFIAVILISILPFYLFLYFSSLPVENADTSSVYFFLSMILSGAIFFLLPKKKHTDYSDLSILLHEMVLDNYNISNSLFSLERKIFKKKTNSDNKNFFVVTGLARAGTTAFTNLLFETKKFHSLSYANMPFLMAVNLWKKVYKPKNTQLKERAHGDKVLFGYDTIEALEEYFFKVKLNDNYIFSESLEEHQIDEDVYKSYLTYQNLIHDENSDTNYLAKNNNMILRYKSLRSFNKQFKALVIFRSPLNHAESLLKQHLHFSNLQKEDPFTLEYMNWLGHHEFGLNQKYFDFGFYNDWNQYEKSSINYWLAIWNNYYAHILTLTDDNFLFLIDYKDLLNQPESLITTLAKKIDLPLTLPKQEPFNKTEKEQAHSDLKDDLVEKSKNIYNKLVEFKLQVEN